jgi:hypothetical protein
VALPITTLAAAVLPNTILAKSAVLDTAPLVQPYLVRYAQLVMPLVMVLLVPNALLDYTLPLPEPRSAHLALVVLRQIQVELLAPSVMPVNIASLSLVEPVKFVPLVLLPRLVLIFAPLACPAHTLPPMPPLALLAPKTRMPVILVPKHVLLVSQVPILEERLVQQSVWAVVLEPTSTPRALAVSNARLATTKTVQAKKAVRNALLEPLPMLQDLKLAIPALLVNTNPSLVHRVAVPAPVELSPLLARVLAPSAPKAGTLLLALLLVLVALLDTMQTSLVPELAQPALQAPNALVLPTPAPLSALLALSNLSLPKLPVLLAPRRPTLPRLVRPSARHAPLLLLPVLQLAPPPVAGCCLPVLGPIPLSNKLSS